MEEIIQKFLELLEIIIDADGSWQEKKALVISECSAADETNLAEFASWFERVSGGSTDEQD